MSKWSPTFSRSSETPDVSTLLSKDTEIRGCVKSQGSIRIDGTVVGDVVSAQTITVGVTGVIEGNISGEDIIVAGRVKGTITARGRVILESSAQIEGDLNTGRLAITEGAVFRGLSNMGVPARTAARPEAPQAEAARAADDAVAAA